MGNEASQYNVRKAEAANEGVPVRERGNDLRWKSTKEGNATTRDRQGLGACDDDKMGPGG